MVAFAQFNDVTVSLVAADAITGVVADGYIAGATVFTMQTTTALWTTARPATKPTNWAASNSPVARPARCYATGDQWGHAAGEQFDVQRSRGSNCDQPITTLVQALVDQGYSASDAEQRQLALGLSGDLDFSTMIRSPRPRTTRQLSSSESRRFDR